MNELLHNETMQYIIIKNLRDFNVSAIYIAMLIFFFSFDRLHEIYRYKIAIQYTFIWFRIYYGIDLIFLAFIGISISVNHWQNQPTLTQTHKH